MSGREVLRFKRAIGVCSGCHGALGLIEGYFYFIREGINIPFPFIYTGEYRKELILLSSDSAPVLQTDWLKFRFYE